MLNMFKDAFKRELRELDDALDKAISTYLRVFRDIFVDYPVNKLKDLAGRSRGYDPQEAVREQRMQKNMKIP